MADELSDYLQGVYIDEKRDIERLKGIGSRVLGVFERFFDQAEGQWPYEVVAGQQVPRPERFSFSTNAMIVFALAVSTGRISRSGLIPTVKDAPIATRDKKQQESLDKIAGTALAQFPSEIDESRKDSREEVRAWKGAQTDRGRSPDVPLCTTSESFGPNDPLTLTWLLEVLGEGTLAGPEVRERLMQDLKEPVVEIVTSTCERPDYSPLRLRSRDLVPHAFPLLRVLHLVKAAELLGWQPVPSVDGIRAYLLDRAHLHLSSVSIQDGGFDAGELVFSLEGLLLCDPSLPDYSLFDRAFEVLVATQRETPYWRPLRPFRVTKQGMVLLPQSVEIANSLLRICSRLDEERDRSYFTEYVDLFKAYTRWLESRMFVGKTKDDTTNDIFGWQSEHTFAPNRIHLWQTSQALLYLMHYAAMLQGHIARRSFRAARFSPTSARWTRKPNPDSWTKFERTEPMGSLPPTGQYAVYRIIRDRIIQPRASGSRPDSDWSSSAVLYGPPGTGKSRIAKEIAQALGFGLVTITPSDFITAGQEAVEARAKNIFTTLMEQTNLVVLFDEVDQLLLDREGDLYQRQSDIFKMITPGMLTKLNDLTERKGLVFAIATNYFERIDPAIKRTGRINLRLLVLPPDKRQRARFLSEGPNREDRPEGPLFPGWDSMTDQGKDEIVKKTALYTYGELEELASRVGGGQEEGEELKGLILDRCSEFRSTISLASYKNRVVNFGENAGNVIEGGPLEEFVMVVYIAAESAQITKRDLERDLGWVKDPLRVAWEKEKVNQKQEQVWDVLKNAEVLDV